MATSRSRVWTYSVLLMLFSLNTLTVADAIYTKNSPVLQVNSKNYDSLIAQSNHTSVVEFYAPWCGHCQSLKPAYEKVAKSLAGLAKVAAINCDDESNKPLCGKMGVQGFPTLKIVKPGSKPGKPIVEDYQGARSAKAIVDAVVDKIPNHVKKLQATGLDSWLASGPTQAKAILFTEKGITSALVKALAVDFLGIIDFAQVRSKEEAAIEKYGIKEFPSIILIPNQGQEPISYAEEMKKESLVSFFSQIAPPNPDPAPKTGKASKGSESSKGSKSSTSTTVAADFAKASEAHKSIDLEDFIGKSETIILDDNTPNESPLPIVESDQKPIEVPEMVAPIPQLATPEDLETICLSSKSGSCLLALLPAISTPDSELPAPAVEALASLADIADKHQKRRASMFPFYNIPAENKAGTRLRNEIGLGSDTALEILAINVKRGWWRHYAKGTYGVQDLETFVDSVKLGEGSKQKLPDHFFENPSPRSDEASPSKDEL